MDDPRTRRSFANPAGSRWVGRGAVLGAVLLSFLFVASSAIAAPVLAPSSLSPTAGGALHVAPTGSVHAALPAPAHSSSPRPLAPTPSASSGPGIFFENHPVPTVPSNRLACGTGYYASYCNTNDTDEPSINYTSNGVLAVAYTATVNLTECPGQASNSSSVVAVTTSRTLGQAWSTPTYLSNPICTGYGANFSSAAQPSITSLSNGSLVLAYEQFNQSKDKSCAYCFLPASDISCYYTWYDQVVVRESYDNGSTWTSPTVLSNVTDDKNGTCGLPGAIDVQPSVAATGNTVYVAWTNMSTDYIETGVSMGADLIVSTDGGATWGAIQSIQPVPGYGTASGSSNSAMTPSLLIGPSGVLWVAYLTALNESLQTIEGCPCYDYPEAQLEFASSTNNGTSFNYSRIGEIGVQQFCCYQEEYLPTPSLSYSATTGQIFVGYTSADWIDPTVNEGVYGHYSAPYEQSLLPGVANSSTSGASWTTRLVPGIATEGGLYNQAWNPSITTTPDGVLHLQLTYVNDSQCPYFTFGACGVIHQLYYTSPDNGTTFSSPVDVTPNWSASEDLPYDPGEGGWLGEYSSMLSIGPTVVLAWTAFACGTTDCYIPYSPANITVVISTLYTGTGLTLTFSQTGLPSGAPWSINIMGNIRSGSSSTNLVVSGVPSGQTEYYLAPWVNQTWGITYASTLSPAGPSSFAASGTVTVTFTEDVLFTIATSPPFQSDCWTVSGDCSNYMISPTPGSMWTPAGTTFTITLATVAFYTYPNDPLNMSFVSWTGTGPGNYTGLSPNITVTPTGPVNETANFVVTGQCQLYYIFPTGYSLECHNETSFPLIFQQNGLPSGTSWSVTTTVNNGTITTGTDTAPGDILFSVPATPTQFSVWTVPDGSTGQYWVPTTSQPSPLLPLDDLVVVNFSLENPTAAAFAEHFVASGLPANTPWSLEVGPSDYGVQSNNTTLQLEGGGPYSINGSAVYLENGFGYYASSVAISPYVVNDSGTSSSSAPGSFSLDGPGLVTISYAPMYLLTTVASTGGTVTPATGWNHAGTSITLHESADAKYHFVGWTGSGSGSSSTSQDSETAPAITPSGPVTEFATFRANAAPTWNLSVSESGLPAGTSYAISIGASAFSGPGSFLVGNITNGSYAFSVPYVYYNSSNTTRFAPVGFQSSLTLGAGDQLSIIANGTLTVEFQAQYLLNLGSTPAAGGTISPAAGVYWDDAGQSVPLMATPSAGYEFVGWNSSTGALTSNATSFPVVLTGPLSIDAQFKLRPIPPVLSYGLAVTEIGLPTGVAWNVSAATNGIAGPGTTLTLLGLNGSYTVQVPAVNVGTGVRWVANATDWNLTVHANSSLSVSFTKQYLVTASGGEGGSITPAGATWLDSGSTLSLVATPNATSTFVGWNGTGTSSYTGSASTTQITVGSPVTEVASFTPIYVQKTTSQGSSTSGMPLALGLLVGLLVVGLLVGLLVGSRRRSPPSAPPEEWQEATPSGPEEPEAAESVYGDAPAPSEEGTP